MPESWQDPTGIPQESLLLPRWQLFLAGSIPRKIPSPHLRKSPTKETVLSRIPQRKTLLQDPSESPAGKQNLSNIPSENLILVENLYILVADMQIL